MQKYKLFGLAPPIWVAQYIYSIDIQRIIKCESKRCQSQEKDILYAFSIPMYYGKGSRYYLNIKYDLTNSISLWCKFAQTVYADGRESISSGKEEIKGNRKSDVRFMLRWEF